MGRGRAAEELLTWIFRRLEQDGVAWVRKTHPETGVDREGRRFFRAAGPPDYLGWMTVPGKAPLVRAVAFDVKETRARSWAWPEGRNLRTKQRQMADLRSAGEQGALAGLLIIFWPTRGVTNPMMLWVPWRSLPLVSTGSWTAERLRGEAFALRVVWPAGEDPHILGTARSATDL